MPSAPAPAPVVAIATLADDQGPWLLEWVVWHRLAGFTRVVICHGADDSAADLIVALAQQGLAVGVTVTPTVAVDRAAQVRAAINSPATRSALQGVDWLMVAEVHDFLHSPPTPPTNPARPAPGADHPPLVPTDVSRLIDACPGTDGMALPAVTFGTGGQGHFANRPVTARFTFRHDLDAVHRLPLRVFARFDPGWTYGLHRPTPPEGIVARWHTPGGDEVCSDSLTWFLRPDQTGAAHAARINRYPLRSAEEYALFHPGPMAQAALGEFTRLNAASTHDDSATARANATAKAMAAAQQDPALGRALAHQLDHLRTRLTERRAAPSFATDMRRLLAEGHRAAPSDPLWLIRARAITS